MTAKQLERNGYNLKIYIHFKAFHIYKEKINLDHHKKQK